MTKQEKIKLLSRYCSDHRCETCPAGLLVDEILGSPNEDCLVTALRDTVEGDEGFPI